jgi:hypothetical protein
MTTDPRSAYHQQELLRARILMEQRARRQFLHERAEADTTGGAEASDQGTMDAIELRIKAAIAEAEKAAAENRPDALEKNHYAADLMLRHWPRLPGSRDR